MKNLTKIASILLLWMASQGASAYNYILCDDGITPLYAGQGVRTFQEGSNLFDSEVTATIQAFARLSAFSAGSATLVGPPDPAPALNNGQNEVWWDGTVPTAVCNTRYYVAPTCSVIESDIRIGAPTWYTLEDSNHTPYGNLGRSVQGVMVHEGGHCIGLGHTNNLYNIMGDERTHVDRNNTTTFYGPGEDASDGLIDLHGERSGGADTYRDVSVTTWRYSHASGAYSAHKQGRLLDVGGTELTKTGNQWVGQDEYTINAGETFQMEYTTQNSGEMNSENTDVSFRLSTNPIISTGDTEIGYYASFGFSRGAPFEDTRSGLVIPLTTAPGDYWVGVIVDVSNNIPETEELKNNYAHYPITIPPPDLTVTAPSVSDTTPTTTQTITGFATINNVGGAQSAATTLRYYRSTNSIISTGDTQVATDAQAIINPGASVARSEPFIFSATAGTYWYGACVDTVAGETVTNNQCSSAVQVTVTDIAPPSPNPMTFSVFPHELNTSQIAMTATTATDPSGGIEYYLLYTGSPTGGANGTSSGWQASASYTDSGLQPNEEYCYRAFAHDTYNNQTSPSAIDCDYTRANQPVLASFSNITQTSIQVNLGNDGNPAGTNYWMRNATTGQFQSWSTSKTFVNTGLSCGTSYTYGAWSQNGDGAIGAEVVLGSASTLACPADTDGDGIQDSLDNCTLVANGPLAPDAGGNIQLDTDGDGYGNICDADLDGDYAVGFSDFNLFSGAFGTADPDADFDGDGTAGFSDFVIFRASFGSTPGPSCCAP